MLTLLQTNDKKQMGTTAYMAPEIFDLKPKYSIYSDMYRFGWADEEGIVNTLIKSLTLQDMHLH